MSDKYDDIRHLPYPLPNNRKRMSMTDRAAQFSPFAALVGYEDTIEETARITDQKAILDEHEKSILDQRQRQLLQVLDQRPEVTVTYFSPDDKKEGGSYVTHSGILKAVLPHCRRILLWDGTEISMDEIIALDSAIFRE
ncbi:MAG: hypothetical protein E7438_06835 [Ruminococcaceae bacterium]|nr:hypothetical protein [Oscillospiraceae bacterium]